MVKVSVYSQAGIQHTLNILCYDLVNAEGLNGCSKDQKSSAMTLRVVDEIQGE